MRIAANLRFGTMLVLGMTAIAASPATAQQTSGQDAAGGGRKSELGKGSTDPAPMPSPAQTEHRHITWNIGEDLETAAHGPAKSVKPAERIEHSIGTEDHTSAVKPKFKR
jgi:Spy/CpxP family protein refolding chaperone